MEGSPKFSKSCSSVPGELGLFSELKTGDVKKGNDPEKRVRLLESSVSCDAKNTDDCLRIDQVEVGEAERQKNKNRREVEEISLELMLGNAASIPINRKASESFAKLRPSAARGSKRMKGQRREAGEEASHGGVSLDLKLYVDPWVIKKRIEMSDIGNMARLLLARDTVKKHILPLWDAERIKNINNGERVAVWDWDTESEHQVVFKQWPSGSYVLIGSWTKEFVNRRELNKGDEVGLYWDRSDSRFNFSILKRAPND